MEIYESNDSICIFGDISSLPETLQSKYHAHVSVYPIPMFIIGDMTIDDFIEAYPKIEFEILSVQKKKEIVPLVKKPVKVKEAKTVKKSEEEEEEATMAGEEEAGVSVEAEASEEEKEAETEESKEIIKTTRKKKVESSSSSESGLVPSSGSEQSDDEDEDESLSEDEKVKKGKKAKKGKTTATRTSTRGPAKNKPLVPYTFAKEKQFKFRPIDEGSKEEKYLIKLINNITKKDDEIETGRGVVYQKLEPGDRLVVDGKVNYVVVPFPHGVASALSNVPVQQVDLFGKKISEEVYFLYPEPPKGRGKKRIFLRAERGAVIYPGGPKINIKLKGVSGDKDSKTQIILFDTLMYIQYKSFPKDKRKNVIPEENMLVRADFSKPYAKGVSKKINLSVDSIDGDNLILSTPENKPLKVKKTSKNTWITDENPTKSGIENDITVELEFGAWVQ